ncbi:MAG: PAS domain-containing sensor histidine kinase [Bacteroidales bacterium]|jgi:PAS domain S-box-containing protein
MNQENSPVKNGFNLGLALPGLALVLLGAIGLLSFIDFFLILARIRKDYIPMAPDTGLIFFLYGLVLMVESKGAPRANFKRARLIVVGIVTVYSTLKFIQFFTDLDLTLEDVIFPVHDKLNQFPLHHMSPVTGSLFCLAGIAYFLSHSGTPNRLKSQAVNLLGTVIGSIGAIGLMGYLFRSPYLYTSNVIPMAATTTFCFGALGIGLMYFAGEESYIFRLFNRQTTLGRLMGVVLPLVVFAIIFQGLVQVYLIDAGIIDHAIISALLAILFSIVTPLIIIQVSGRIYRHHEKIEVKEKETQEILLHERERLRTLIDNLPDRIFFKDRSSRFIIANNSTALHCGLNSPADLVGKTDFDLYKLELAEQYFKDEQDLMVKGDPLINHEEPSMNSSGIEGWTLTSKIPIRNRAGQVIGLIGVCRDITEIKKVHGDLVAAKEIAEQASKLKDYFIANLSHEIRTPLNAIIGFSELLKEEVEHTIPEVSEKYFPIIEESSQRLVRTIDLILNLSRLQSGLWVTRSVHLDLDLIIRNLVREFKLNARQKELKLIFENSVGPAFLDTDEYCVVHSISNLLDNALKYTYKGYVSVKLYTDEPGWIKLDVQDTGIGINAEYRQKLFEPFSQEDTSYTRQFEGIGLGLSITKKMLDAIGARIWVASTKDVGSTFTIAFPTNTQDSV